MAAVGVASEESRPLVSIIVRAEGPAARERALASLAAQTWEPLEAVVVEAEGEAPGAWPEGGRPHLRTARAGGGGRGTALNAGLDAASGDLVGFLDGLDVVDPEHVARLAAHLVAEPEAGAAVSHPGLGTALTLSLLDVAAGRAPRLSDVLVRRRVLAAGARFDEALERCGDWEFCLQVARLEPIVPCPGDALTGRSLVPGVESAAEARELERARVWERWKGSLTGAELAALVEKLAGEAERASAAVAVVERRALDVEAELQLVVESRSWWLTMPLRALAAHARRARGREGLAPRSISAVDPPSAGASTGVVTWTGAPLVSVVLPVFNACRSNPAFLEEAIASVAHQTYPAVELVVVDDGSTDGSAVLARQILDRHERLPSRLVTTPNRGQSAARNHGVTLARGSLLSFIDQDDVFLPTKLATVVPCLLDQADVVYTDADIITSGQRTGVRRFHRTLGCGQPHPKRSVEDILFGNAFVMPGLTTVRRELFERAGGFDPDLSGYEDDDLFLRLFESGRVRYLPVSTLLWRMHRENYSFSARMVRSRRHYFEKLIRLHAREGRDRLRTRGIALRFLGEFLSEAARQYRDGTPQYRDNLAGAREVRRYLPRWRAALVEARWLGWALAARALARPGVRRDAASELRAPDPSR